MEIRLSKPDEKFSVAIACAALGAGCCAAIKWTKPDQIRFVLLDETGRQAPSAVQDCVIRLLLTLDPQATIKTARAVYESLSDFEAQLAARVP